jgi:adenine phosphoribosyltransferase
MTSHVLEGRLRDAIASIGGHMDVWAVFEDGGLLGAVVDALADALEPLEPTKIVAVESRGFLLGGAVAARLGIGFAAVRKPGSLFPGEKTTIVTGPDYRGNRTELRFLVRSVDAADTVALVDDWIEMGAQALAVRELVEGQGAPFLGLATMVDQASVAVAEAVPVLVSLIDGDSLDDGGA